jgi:sugar phosphate isomerase/epimerase
MRFTTADVAVQLYTLRDHFKTRADVAETLARVREIGYGCVQFFEVPLPVEEMRGLLDEHGLSVCGVDVPPDRLEREFEVVLEEMAVLGSRYITFSYGGDWDKPYLEGLDDFIRRMNAIGERLESSECRFAYHNHSWELVRHGDASALDYFYEQTEDAGILAEIDTYWIQHGGGDPAAWIRRYAGRVPIVHVKDLVIERAGEPIWEVRQAFAEVGAGNMNWPAVLYAAADAGVEWLVVEQDTCAGDPFDSVAQSYRYLEAALGREKA